MFRERSPGKRRRRTSSRGIAHQKLNRRTPRARFAGGRGFQRHHLSRYSVRAEVRDGESQRAAEMWSLGSEGKIELTDDFYFYACGGEGESRPRNSGDGNWRNQLASTIKERETPVIMLIKLQNLGTPARRLPATPTASARRRRARVALMCPFLSFSIKMDNFQPNKLSQRSVKIPYAIEPYNA